MQHVSCIYFVYMPRLYKAENHAVSASNLPIAHRLANHKDNLIYFIDIF